MTDSQGSNLGCLNFQSDSQSAEAGENFFLVGANQALPSMICDLTGHINWTIAVGAHTPAYSLPTTGGANGHEIFVTLSDPKPHWGRKGVRNHFQATNHENNGS